MTDDLGNRMKHYEGVSKTSLLRKMPVVLRVDGRAFHTFTKDAIKPFDRYLIECMVRAGESVAREMQGFILGYHQSDEFSFYIDDSRTEKSEAWFDNEIQKLVSITASLFTAHFNFLYRRQDESVPPAVFDCRAFNVPANDVPNLFVWRQRDWIRNSVQMLSRNYFSHKEVQNKSNLELKEMLLRGGVDWNRLEQRLKYGTFITKDKIRISERFSYYDIEDIIQTYKKINEDDL